MFLSLSGYPIEYEVINNGKIVINIFIDDEIHLKMIFFNK